MSRRYPFLLLVALLAACVSGWAGSNSGTDWGMDMGTPQFQSVSALAFGPDGVLFLGDSETASLFAIDLSQDAPSDWSDGVNVPEIDEQIAGLLGTSAKEIVIHDMATHPTSHNIYVAVSRGRDTDAIPVVIRVSRPNHVEELSLDNVRFSKTAIRGVPDKDAKDRRGRSLRTQAITDIGYADGYVYVAGLSNEEFASHLRRVPFPFADKTMASSLEIYHVSHGRYETNSPVRTFMPYTIDNKQHIVAAYTCTPLVTFSVDDLQDGAKVKGKTVAELGNRNRPLDIIAYQREGKDYVLIANSNRTVMRIDAEDLKTAQTLTAPLEERYGTAGVRHTSMPMVGVLQLDNLDAEHIVILQREVNDGTLTLRSSSKARL